MLGELCIDRLLRQDRLDPVENDPLSFGSVSEC